MTPEQRQRFEMLRSGPCVPLDYVRDYYGLEWPLQGPAASSFGTYVRTLPRRVNCPDGHLSRYELEGFMSRNDVLTKKWMGTRLGMSVGSLDTLLLKLDVFGMQASRYLVGSEFVAESLSEDLTRYVPGLRFRTFGNHTAFCERLHVELKKEIGLEVDRLFCATADRLGEHRLFAAHFDCLTLEPLSTRHSAWLDFHKPLNLPQDRCSKLLYVENRDVLRPFSAGSREPDNLGEYEHFLEGAHNG
jgi:hypothetical protein